MNHSEKDCIFCKIIKGDIPSAKVYEDEHVLAFLDISQVTKGHTLVIPKVHKQDVFALTSDVSENVFKTVPKIANALKAQYEPVGLNVLNNNGEKAGQSVFHFHIHLIPRYENDNSFGLTWKTHYDTYTPEELKNMADSIASHL